MARTGDGFGGARTLLDMSGAALRPRPFARRRKLEVETGIEIALERVGPPAGRPVLLVHGASAASDTFFLPRPGRSLVSYLAGLGCAVWLLDWRMSFHVVEASHAGPTPPPFASFRLEAAAADIELALDEIEAQHPGEPVAILAHCLGAGMLSQLIAKGGLAKRNVGAIVLSTLGLFYRVSAEGVFKAQDRLLQRLADDRGRRWLSPHDDQVWEGAGRLAKAYALYRGSPLGRRRCPEAFRRLSFMFGRPYLPQRVARSVHTAGMLRRQFGAMHLAPYLQGTANIRRGWAAENDDRPRDRELLDPEPFRALSITLVTGGRNPLWHRDAIDRMAAFLRRADRPGARPLRKHVFRGYGHQDLFWSDRSFHEVFPVLGEAVSL